MNATDRGGMPGRGRIAPYVFDAHGVGVHGDKGRSGAITGAACIDVD
ncbi:MULTISPECIES: hypothetical protein [Burkholderia]|uniref:Uncharacterized protein n=1 Tax=Burkholderia aenigmatica TaxID=2015348 RepID=A0ABY6Y0K7_9BURK|nr:MULTISPECIES: hypothetical protein [Burkholderia]VWC64420.1 hypothetical protein BLA18628_00030 [Burkholderia aenigmatica]VWC86061.1 hypothetical protein BLA17378_04246 [Burkholderia aenigmatica]